VSARVLSVPSLSGEGPTVTCQVSGGFLGATTPHPRLIGAARFTLRGLPGVTARVVMARTEPDFDYGVVVRTVIR
jgi:hypothetical protein